MRPGVYKHENCTDTAIRVVRSYYIPQKKGYKVKVWWLCVVNPDNVRLLWPTFVTEFIKSEDRLKWKPMRYPGV